ncbi:replication factor A protein 3 [Peziza echinospora]|nr:replication factor A protein 3 [Peziza echinospora]
MNDQTPRVNAPLLERFVNQTVRLVGKVISLRGETATLDASGQVLVHLNSGTHWSVGHAVEVIAKVQQDLSLRVLTSIDLGTDVDFNAVDAVVDATHRYKEIFYDS